MFNPELLKDKNIYPMTAPGQDGKTRKLSIAPNDFGDDCETINFKFVPGKGIFMTFNADIETYEMIMASLEQSLRKREPSHTTYVQKFKNKPSSYLTVGRLDDGLPFMRLKATPREGGERHKDFFFTLPRNIEILRDGKPISDLEKAEKACLAFLKTQVVFVEGLKNQYKARVWQQGGGYGGGNGGNGGNGGGGNGGYNRQQQQPAPSDTEFNDMF